MHRMSRNVVVVTCASTGRLEHGTRRTSPEGSPGTGLSGYYRNLTAADFAAIDLATMFRAWEFFYAPYSHDLYFIGWKKPPADRASFRRGVRAIVNNDTRTLANKVFYFPATVASKFLRDETFQAFFIAYLKLTGPIRRLIRS